MLDNTLTLLIGGQRLSGWQGIAVSRGIERVPSSFQLDATERYPGAARVDIRPGQPCQVMIGPDLVLTGYVDRYMAEITPGSHTISVPGRSRVQDLVDCSARLTDASGHPTMMANEPSVLQLAQDLSKPFGIEVLEPDGEPAPITGGDGTIPPFAIALGETAFEVIERTARWKRLLVYDDTQGRLVLARIGTQSMASGVDEAVNMQRAAASLSMDERFSDYIPALFTTEGMYNLGQGSAAGNEFPAIKDPGVPRYRPHFVVSEQFMAGHYLAEDRAKWEMARRFGRSQAVRVTVDSWRDSAGALWEPNRLCPVNLPSLKIVRQRWIIAAVTYRMDLDGGTTAELELMPPEAFEPAPNFALPFDYQTYLALNPSADPNFNPRLNDPIGGA